MPDWFGSLVPVDSGCMRRKVCLAGLIVGLLAPSAYLAWSWRSMPQLDFYHDDSLYWVSAQSLATGAGYRIASLPLQPFQTKYPPLFPAFLSLVWKLNPHFPANLPLATLVVWLVFPAYLFLAYQFFRQCGLKPKEQVVLTAIAALNPVAVVFSFSLMPELLFTSFLLGSLLLAERGSAAETPARFAVLSGLLAALAYLTRSAALPLLVTVPVGFVLHRQYRRAWFFAGAMLPAVVAWQGWVQGRLSHAWDLVTLYYTNYLGFQLYNVPFQDVPLVIWHNLDAYLIGIGRLLTFDIALADSKHFERVIAIAAIAGAVRFARKTGQWQMPLAALGYSVMLLVWHYQPDQRFVFPLYPLLAVGLWAEAGNVVRALGKAWAKPERSERIAAALGAGAIAACALFITASTVAGLFWFLPRLFGAYEADLAARRPVYQWIANNSPKNANVFAYDDPLIYLYAQRRSCNLPIPTRLYYHNDDAGIDRLLHSIDSFARQNRLDYVLLTPGDFYRDLHENGARHLSQAVQDSASFSQLYRTPNAAVYRLIR